MVTLRARCFHIHSPYASVAVPCRTNDFGVVSDLLVGFVFLGYSLDVLLDLSAR